MDLVSLVFGINVLCFELCILLHLADSLSIFPLDGLDLLLALLDLQIDPGVNIDSIKVSWGLNSVHLRLKKSKLTAPSIFTGYVF